MSKPVIIILIILIYSLGFVTGVVTVIDTQPKKEISYVQLEKDLDKAQCQVEKIEAILAERIRLTGKVNP